MHRTCCQYHVRSDGRIRPARRIPEPNRTIRRAALRSSRWPSTMPASAGNEFDSKKMHHLLPSTELASTSSPGEIRRENCALSEDGFSVYFQT